MLTIGTGGPLGTGAGSLGKGGAVGSQPAPSCSPTWLSSRLIEHLPREKLVGWPILPGLKTLRLSQTSGIEVGSPSPPGWNQLRACPDSQGLKRAPGNPLDAKSKIIQRAFSPACSWFHHRPGVGSSLVSTGSSAAFEVSPSRKQSVTLKKGSDHFAFDLRRVYQKGRPHV